MTRKILLTALLIFLVLFAFYARVIFQEGNPLPQLSGIIQLNFSKNKIVKLAGSNTKYMTKSRGGRDSLVEFMKEKNYQFVDQMGAGYFFKIDNQENIVITHRYYTRYYDIWNFPNNNQPLPVTSSATEISTSTVQFNGDETFSGQNESALYENKNLGFYFNYPKAYQNNVCDVRESKDVDNTIFYVGSRIELVVSDYTHNLDILAKDIKIQSSGDNETQLVFITINGERVLKKAYRFGGLNRYGESTYFIKNNKLYELGFTAGGFNCGFEPGIYESIVKSFRTTKISMP